MNEWDGLHEMCHMRVLNHCVRVWVGLLLNFVVELRCMNDEHEISF